MTDVHLPPPATIFDTEWKMEEGWWMIGGDSSQWSMVNGRRYMVNGQWSMINGPWSMANGQWSMINGTRSMVKWSSLIISDHDRSS